MKSTGLPFPDNFMALFGAYRAEGDDPEGSQGGMMEESSAIEIKALMAKFESKKIAIAKLRDEMRDLYDEIATALESIDCGIDYIDDGIRMVCDGVDSISEVV